jgi:hypothetical protein
MLITALTPVKLDSYRESNHVQIPTNVLRPILNTVSNQKQNLFTETSGFYDVEYEGGSLLGYNAV